jgi:hypothetical protein
LLLAGAGFVDIAVTLGIDSMVTRYLRVKPGTASALCCSIRRRRSLVTPM